MRIVDTHVHVACADATRFPRRPTGVGSSWWTEPSGHASAVYEAARRAGVDHVAVVQAVGAYGYDCRCASESVIAAPGFASLVAAIDMSAPEPVAPPGGEQSVGWRLFGVADGAPWLEDPRADAIFELADASGVALVATIFADRIPALRAVARRHPGVRVAVDHCAFPDMAPEGERLLMSMAEDADVVLKVSSHVLAAWERDGVLVESFSRLVAAFGVERMCWGSDHPQHQGLTYAEKLALARTATVDLDDAGRAMFFAGTAVSLGWGGAGPAPSAEQVVQ